MRIFMEYFIYLMNIIEIYLFVFSKWIFGTLCLCQLVNKFYSFGFYSTLYFLASLYNLTRSDRPGCFVFQIHDLIFLFSTTQNRVHRIGLILGNGVEGGGEAAKLQSQTYLWWETILNVLNSSYKFHQIILMSLCWCFVHLLGHIDFYYVTWLIQSSPSLFMSISSCTKSFIH